MKNNDPTLKNIAKEIFSPGYWTRAAERRRASKTIWDLIFLPITFGAVGAFGFAFCKAFLWLHVVIYPADHARLDVLLAGHMTLAGGLITLVPAFSAIPLGLMTSNALMWLVPWARLASEKKAKGVKWASFREAQIALFKIALVLVPVGIISGIIGAYALGR